MRAPLDGAADWGKSGPSGEEETGGGDFPVETGSDVKDGEGFLGGEGGDAVKPFDGGEALVEVVAGEAAI